METFNRHTIRFTCCLSTSFQSLSSSFPALRHRLLARLMSLSCSLGFFFFVCSGSSRPRCRSSQKESFQIPCQPCSWRPSPDCTYSPLPRARLRAVTRTSVGGKTARLDTQNSLSYLIYRQNGLTKQKQIVYLFKGPVCKINLIYEFYTGKKLAILPINTVQ